MGAAGGRWEPGVREARPLGGALRVAETPRSVPQEIKLNVSREASRGAPRGAGQRKSEGFATGSELYCFWYFQSSPHGAALSCDGCVWLVALTEQCF